MVCCASMATGHGAGRYSSWIWKAEALAIGCTVIPLNLELSSCRQCTYLIMHLDLKPWSGGSVVQEVLDIIVLYYIILYLLCSCS